MRDFFQRGVSASLQAFRSELSRVIAQFMGSSMLSVLVQAVAGLVVARLAGPDRMGYIVLVSLVTVYSPYLLVATNNGLNRQIPLLMSKGRIDEAAQLAGASLWWSNLTSGLLFIGLLVAGGWQYGIAGERMLGEAVAAYALVGPLANYDRLLQSTYRTKNDIRKLAKIKIAITVVSAVLLGLLLLHPWYGLLGRVVLLKLTQVVLLWRFSPLALKPRMDFRDLWRVIKIGVPLFLVGELGMLMSNMDRTAIAIFLKPEELGLYAPAMQLAGPMLIFSQSIMRVLYPQSCIVYGRTNTSRSLAKYTLFPQAILTFALLPVFAAVVWLMDPIVRLLLPEYTGGITAARWVVVAMYFRSISIGAMVHSVIFRNVFYGISIVFATVVSFLVVTYLVNVHDYGIVAAGIAKAAAMFTFMLLSTLSAIYYIFIRPVYGDPDDQS